MNAAGLSEELFDIDTLIFDHGQIDEVWLCHKDGTPYVGVKCEGIPELRDLVHEECAVRMSGALDGPPG